MSSPRSRVADLAARRVFEQVMAERAALGPSTAADTPELCAIAVIQGPATSFDIRIGLFNTVADPLSVAVIDSFFALGGASLLHDSIFSVSPPLLGTATVSYPNGVAGRGPAVLSFTNFDQFDSASFNTDPDTYDDPAFGATVAEMDQTQVELVYGGGRRCVGRFFFSAPLNASLAFITQVHP